MQFNSAQLGVGIAAGLATALLSVGVVTGASLGMAIYFFSPLPVMAAGLGWGLPSGILAAIVACVAVGIGLAPMSALVVAASTLVPALVAAWFFGLARPAGEVGGPQDKLVWYPLADTLLRLAIAVSAGFILLGAVTGYGTELVGEVVSVMVTQLRDVNPQFTADAAFEEGLTAFMTRALPYLQTGLWFAILAANLYMAARITGASGRFARPAESWPHGLRMPKPALVILAAAMALSFMSGALGHAAGAVAGPLCAGFIMAGTAMLHRSTLGKPGRPLLLWLTYMAMFLFAPALLALFVAGLFDTSRSAPLSCGGQPPSSNNNQT